VDRLLRLEVVRPRQKRLQRKVELVAQVDALKRVDLAARVPGVVGWLPDSIDIGRQVHAGEVLLKLDVPDLEADRRYKEALLEQTQKQEIQAREALAVAQREVEETQKEEKRYLAESTFQRQRLTRIRSLVRDRAQDPQMAEEALRQSEAADAALDANRARVQTRQAKLRAALADLAVAIRKVEVARADAERVQTMIKLATLEAPFSGVITRRWVDPGATIKDPGTNLLTLAQMDRVRILIDVPQRDVPFMNARDTNPNPDGKGDPVVVRIPALTEISRLGEFPGTLTRLSRNLDPITRTMRAEIELDNKEGHIQPGMYCKATVVVEDRSDVLTLPASALSRQRNGVVEVHVITDVTQEGNHLVGILRKLPVGLGIDDGNEVEIRTGLQGHELVVARGNTVMRVDDRVIAIPIE
jgi:RND family efflux transporter MFP subunit